ncbi:MAG: hypothetical protein WCT99_02170 [Bacteroidota bacterium]|jgi:hypothetical protein
MGQQQLLLIILGVIIVGIAVAVALTLFNDNASSSNRNAMTTDLLHLAAKARHYYGRPTSMGGGGRSFTGLTIDKLVTDKFIDNANGLYSVDGVYGNDSVVFRGVGKVKNPDGSDIILTITVLPQGPRNILNVQ